MVMEYTEPETTYLHVNDTKRIQEGNHQKELENYEALTHGNEELLNF